MEILVGTLIVVLFIVIVALAAALVLRSRGEQAKPSGDALRAEFQALSQAALREANEQFLALAEQRFARLTEAGSHDLQGKKTLIDQQLENMKKELGKVTDLVQRVERDREAKFGQLTTEIKNIGQQANALTASTTTLREALASSRSRGQWGERMAEDILRMMGFVEGVNYERQKSVDGGRSRPDFTFLLPKRLKINMDVKFPLENYLNYLDAGSDSDRSSYQKAFLGDVKARVNEVSGRDYIDPGQGTVDYVLLFIPNESVYAFIHENDRNAMDSALEKKVIWCSPLTLYCVLAVVRKAVENFAMDQRSDEIISLVGTFEDQWRKFSDSMDTLGKRLSSTQTAFDTLTGVRSRGLERSINRIEQLRQNRGLSAADLGDDLGDLFKLPPGHEEAGAVDGDGAFLDGDEPRRTANAP